MCEFCIYKYIFFSHNLAPQGKLTHLSDAQLKQQQLISELEETLYWISWKVLCHFANTVTAERIFKGTFDYLLVMIFFGFMHWF